MWGNDKSGSDVAVGCLAEALLWSFSDFDCDDGAITIVTEQGLRIGACGAIVELWIL